MKISFLPQTKLGKWAGGLVGLWPVLMALGSFIFRTVYPETEVGNSIIEDLRLRPLLAMTMILGIGFGVASLPMNLVAIFKKGERSVISFLAMSLGLFLVVLLLGEIFVQH